MRWVSGTGSHINSGKACVKTQASPLFYTARQEDSKRGRVGDEGGLWTPKSPSPRRRKYLANPKKRA